MTQHSPHFNYASYTEHFCNKSGVVRVTTGGNADRAALKEPPLYKSWNRILRRIHFSTRAIQSPKPSGSCCAEGGERRGGEWAYGAANWCGRMKSSLFESSEEMRGSAVSSTSPASEMELLGERKLANRRCFFTCQWKWAVKWPDAALLIAVHLLCDLWVPSSDPHGQGQAVRSPPRQHA